MTKKVPRIFISLLLMLLCIGILPVSAFASDGDYPDDALPTAESSAALFSMGFVKNPILKSDRSERMLNA